MDDWLTPTEMVARIEAFFGRIGLDPCAERGCKNIPAARRWCRERDGLSKYWPATTVFVNPPYSRGQIAQWVEKAKKARDGGAEVIMLLPARTDTQWFAALNGEEILFLQSRLVFGRTQSGGEICWVDRAPWGSMLVYLGLRSAQFRRAFCDLGGFARTKFYKRGK